MREIPFPKITLNPWNLKDSSILEALPNRVCQLEIKDIMIRHISDYYKAHRPNFPTEPKEFYVIPFSASRMLDELELQQANFSALYLPSIALLQENGEIPEEISESAIVAWDFNFSIFTNQGFALAVDLSMSFPTFIFWERISSGYGFNPNYYFLAEPK